YDIKQTKYKVYTGLGPLSGNSHSPVYMRLMMRNHRLQRK
ncbi:Os05g0450733, partial [Oryza sativa Japonica Group]